MKSKHEKNIFVELTEQQKIDIEMLLTKSSVRALKNLSNTNTPKTVDDALNELTDVLKSELADITFKHMKELAEKDEIIEQLKRQIK